MFKKLSLELGGKNPTLVFADCDFDRMIDGEHQRGIHQICMRSDICTDASSHGIPSRGGPVGLLQ